MRSCFDLCGRAVTWVSLSRLSQAACRYGREGDAPPFRCCSALLRAPLLAVSASDLDQAP